MSRRPDHPVCSSLLPRPLRPQRLRWRRQLAACGLRVGCAGRPGAEEEHAGSGTKFLCHGYCRRVGCPTALRIRGSLCGTNSRIGRRRTVWSPGPNSDRNSGRSSCGTGEGSPPRSAAAASLDAGSRSLEAARAVSSAAANSTAVSSTAVSSRFHWRRCRRGTGGERRPGADDLLSGNRGRSHAVCACQGETPASCLLLKNCLLVQYGPPAVLVSGTGHTAAFGSPTGVPAKI